MQDELVAPGAGIAQQAVQPDILPAGQYPRLLLRQ